jgi:NAD+ synthase (glutamine-hydrolysing)
MQRADIKQAQQLLPELHQKLQELRATKRKFDVNDWIEKKTDMFNEYMKKCKLKAAVVSVSGGVDSAVTIALAKHAQQKKDSPIKRVLGVAQPIHSTEKIWKRALELGKALDIETITVDQSEVFDLLKSTVDKAVGIQGGLFTAGQLKSYMRTPVGFYVAQLLTQEGWPAVVIGTGNKDEDGYLFYFCKAGDGVADIQV